MIGRQVCSDTKAHKCRDTAGCCVCEKVACRDRSKILADDVFVFLALLARTHRSARPKPSNIGNFDHFSDTSTQSTALPATTHGTATVC